MNVSGFFTGKPRSYYILVTPWENIGSGRNKIGSVIGYFVIINMCIIYHEV